MEIPLYFKSYAEPDIYQIVPPEKTWDEGISVPVCGEEDLAPLFQSIHRAAFFANKKLVLLLIVNSTPRTSDYYKVNNDLLLRKLLPFQSYSSALDIVVWDRHTKNKFPVKQGVGLARKIGADILCFWAHHKKLTSSFIHSTDADAILSEDYFYLDTLGKNTSCALHPFEHLLNTKDLLTSQAILLYDRFLKYHRYGIGAANSPYRYIPLGSNLTFSIASYLSVRGFPKKEAGEDFYFLNKMAKVGKIEELGKSLVQLRSREGVRVPFGTNQSVVKIRNLLKEKKPYLVYHPTLYTKLKTFLRALEDFSQSRDLEHFRNSLESEKLLREFCREFKVDEMLIAASEQRKSGEQLRKHIADWMDAFRTLKFLHFVEKDYPKIPLDSSVGELAGLF